MSNAQQEAFRRLLARQSTTPEETVPVVAERVTVTAVAGATYLMKPDAQWTWEDLRDYVTGQIEQYHGPQVRNAMKEASVFKSFLARHGEKAVGIARFAFEVQRGMWQRAPISVNRFCKASDPYFSDVIKDRL
jgi:hypothetical protein